MQRSQEIRVLIKCKVLLFLIPLLLQRAVAFNVLQKLTFPSNIPRNESWRHQLRLKRYLKQEETLSSYFRNLGKICLVKSLFRISLGNYSYPSSGINLHPLPIFPKGVQLSSKRNILRAKTCEQTEFTISSLRSSLHISILQFSNHYRSHIRIRVLSPRIYAYIYRYIFFDKIVHTKYVFAEREGEYHDPDVRYRLSFVRYRTATEQSLT